jgi:hypothetical protein
VTFVADATENADRLNSDDVFNSRGFPVTGSRAVGAASLVCSRIGAAIGMSEINDVRLIVKDHRYPGKCGDVATAKRTADRCAIHEPVS